MTMLALIWLIALKNMDQIPNIVNWVRMFYSTATTIFKSCFKSFSSDFVVLSRKAFCSI